MMHRPTQYILRWTLKVYKVAVSPFLGTRCRFYPSCSVYCVQAIEQKGWLRGMALGIKRIVRCNPWYSGKDYPIDQRSDFNIHQQY